MDSDQLRVLATLLHRNHSPETIAYVEKRLLEKGLTLTKLYQELEMAEQFVEAFRLEGYRNLTSPIHAHRFYEITCCRSSCGAEYLVGAKRYSLQRGDIVLIPPGVSHASLLQNVSGEQYRGYTLWISSDYLRNLQSSYPFLEKHLSPCGSLIRTDGTAWEHLTDYFREAVNEAEHRRPGWDCAVVGATLSLLAKLARAAEEQKSVVLLSGESERLDIILSYVENNLPHRITLEEIAGRFRVSPSTISHLFRREMGISFYQYVMQRRLTEARILLREDMPIEKISEKVGFTDYSAFYRAFRKEYGMSPLQYKKQLTSGLP